MKPNINSVEVHPQMSHNGHPVDDVLAGGCWFIVPGLVFEVEDDPKNVEKCWKKSENVQSLSPQRLTRVP
jgi:hypothetical protein